MLDSFFEIYHKQLHRLENPIRRRLMDEIDWKKRLIAIKGSRGVGKTTFLLQYARENFGVSKRCLYVNFNDFYFSNHSLLDFAAEFVDQGGNTLLLDQTFKYPKWAEDLRAIYDRFPQLRIIFSASPVMRLKEGNEHIGDIVDMYNLRGFSFREFLNLKGGQNFKPIALQEILENHEQIASQISKTLNPLWYFPDYLHHGFYPFLINSSSYLEQLLREINMMLEVDILIIKQIDVNYLPRIRQLLYRMLNDAPCKLNVSQLAEEIDTSRATVMNYLKYLKDARLLNLLYNYGKSFPQKPKLVYLQNTNLLYAISSRQYSPEIISETFFYNALHGSHIVSASESNAKFLVDGKYAFNVAEQASLKPTLRLTAVHNLVVGRNRQIPLWLFGFLY